MTLRPTPFASVAPMGMGFSVTQNSSVWVGGNRLFFLCTYTFCFSFSDRYPALIWIAGDSFIYWAAHRSEVRSYGNNLGFTYDLTRIRWLGPRGLRWPQVLLECLRLRSHVSGPIILILHAGWIDVGYTRSVDLISAIK